MRYRYSKFYYIYLFLYSTESLFIKFILIFSLFLLLFIGIGQTIKAECISLKIQVLQFEYNDEIISSFLIKKKKRSYLVYVYEGAFILLLFFMRISGDFVRANGLQEGDFIVIYSDIKCGKYVSNFSCYLYTFKMFIFIYMNSLRNKPIGPRMVYRF